MLQELEVQNLGPLRKAHLDFSPGMTAITGETGAGKSMLLRAVRLIQGGVSQGEKVSGNQESTWVQAVFDISTHQEIFSLLSEAGFTAEDIVEEEDGCDLFISRQVPREGRSRAVINGKTVPLSVLKEVGKHLVVIHGQADQLSLATKTSQRYLLDRYAQNNDLLEEYKYLWDTWKALQKRLDDVTHQSAQALQRIDYLKDSVEKIELINPQINEDDELRAQRTRAENAADLMQALRGALEALDGSNLSNDEGASVTQLLSRASLSLQKIKGIPEMEALSERLEVISDDISDIVLQLSKEAQEEVPSDEDIDTINSRLHQLADLMKRWGPTLADVLKWKEDAQQEIENSQLSPEAIEKLEKECENAHQKVSVAAQKLHDRRVEAAKKLQKHINDELSNLAMSDAHLEIRITPLEYPHSDGKTTEMLESHGKDDIEFLFSAFPQAPLLPLVKSASGGELSRLMLAIELSSTHIPSSTSSVRKDRNGKNSSIDDSQEEAIDESHESNETNDLNTNSSIKTFIFDEVDAGVGGSAAAELGKRLAQLARFEQVIVITHLAQVAAWAQTQFVVEKVKSTDNTSSHESIIETVVRQVQGKERVEEIARMLSGQESQVSLEHAQELLERCQEKNSDKGSY